MFSLRLLLSYWEKNNSWSFYTRLPAFKIAALLVRWYSTHNSVITLVSTSALPMITFGSFKALLASNEPLPSDAIHFRCWYLDQPNSHSFSVLASYGNLNFPLTLDWMHEYQRNRVQFQHSVEIHPDAEIMVEDNTLNITFTGLHILTILLLSRRGTILGNVIVTTEDTQVSLESRS